LQNLIHRTGTLQGTEFAKRTTHQGPRPNPEIPGNAIVAPGDYTKSRRISLN